MTTFSVFVRGIKNARSNIFEGQIRFFTYVYLFEYDCPRRRGALLLIRQCEISILYGDASNSDALCQTCRAFDDGKLKRKKFAVAVDDFYNRVTAPYSRIMLNTFFRRVK